MAPTSVTTARCAPCAISHCSPVTDAFAAASVGSDGVAGWGVRAMGERGARSTDSGPKRRRYRTGRVRILVTNDDGVHAPGLAALVRALAAWTGSNGHEFVVVAPLANYSGASAAVGTVYEREAIGFRRVRIEGAEGVDVFGLDAPPALTVIVGVFGAFGPRPDIVVSGINLGVNVGRSVLHSGTVGAALTAAQHGLRALAVSMRSQPVPHRWDTAAAVALAVIPVVAAAPPRTVLNLNVPTCALRAAGGRPGSDQRRRHREGGPR